jgi:hypothetical protein
MTEKMPDEIWVVRDQFTKYDRHIVDGVWDAGYNWSDSRGTKYHHDDKYRALEQQNKVLLDCLKWTIKGSKREKSSPDIKVFMSYLTNNKGGLREDVHGRTYKYTYEKFGHSQMVSEYLSGNTWMIK